MEVKSVHFQIMLKIDTSDVAMCMPKSTMFDVRFATKAGTQDASLPVWFAQSLVLLASILMPVMPPAFTLLLLRIGVRCQESCQSLRMLGCKTRAFAQHIGN